MCALSAGSLNCCCLWTQVVWDRSNKDSLQVVTFTSGTFNRRGNNCSKFFDVSHLQSKRTNFNLQHYYVLKLCSTTSHAMKYCKCTAKLCYKEFKALTSKNCFHSWSQRDHFTTKMCTILTNS